MTIREARTILEDMRQGALADAMTGMTERYEALGVAIEAIEHWLGESPSFPDSTRYIKTRDKSIKGAEELAEYKGRGEEVLKTYIYDAGFADCWKIKFK